MTAPHLGPGHTIAGRYTIRALMGFTPEVATYDAVGGDGREVVVKLFDPSIAQRADVMAQLERVRAQVAALGSEGAVAVIDSGYDASTAAPFSVCEKLRIVSLAKLVEKGPQPAQLVAAALFGIATVLDAARAQGLYHLALKPTNVFVGPSPSYVVRVTDFGASVVRNTSPTHETYARSAPFWAPEQMQPAAHLGPGTDVFAAALIAFHALTSRSFWRSCQSSPPDLQAWQAEVMGQRLTVSQRARELGGYFDAALDGPFARSLAVSPRDRPQTVRELANALASLAGHARPEEQPPRTMAFPQIHDPPSDGATVVMQTPLHEASGGGQAAANAYQAPAPHGQTPAPTHVPPSVVVRAAQAEPPVHVTPGLPPFPQPVKKKGNPIVPIAIGVGAAALLGGGAVVVLFATSGGTEAETTPRASSSAGPVSVDTTGSAAPSARAEPSASSDAEGPETGEAGKDGKVAVLFKCVPACDRLAVDDEQVEKPDQQLELAPGRHTIRAEKQGYATLSKSIDIPAEKAFEKELRLVKLGPVTVQPQPQPKGKPQPKPKPQPKGKPCGQFLNPCK